MIHYALQCGDGHAFDGWFRSSAAFDSQVEAGQLECPRCGSMQVARALMAPAVARGAVQVLPAAPAKPAAAMPAEMRATLQRLRDAVERNCDYVGDAFAAQALQMHRGEIEMRGIYGETSAEEAERLHDEGVQVGKIPWIARADS